MVARIEMKLGTHAYHIISMTITCFHDDFEQQQIASRNFCSNLLTVAHIEMKLSTHA